MVNNQMAMVVKHILSSNRVFHIDLVTRVILALLLHGGKKNWIIFLLGAQFIIPLLHKQN